MGQCKALLRLVGEKNGAITVNELELVDAEFIGIVPILYLAESLQSTSQSE